MTDSALPPSGESLIEEAVGTPVVVKDLGSADYQSVWAAMQAFTDSRDASTPDEIWCVQHEPVFTQGQAGKPEHIIGQLSQAAGAEPSVTLAEAVAGSPAVAPIGQASIPVVQTDRGGQVTYHGPGQLVVYPLLNLKRKKLGVRELVTKIEQSVVACLAGLDIDAAAKPDAPGVYVDGCKIASLGLRVRRGCSFHGVSINVAMDLSPFLAINPCGYPALTMTQIADVLPGQAYSAQALFEQVKTHYMACLLAELNSYAAV